MLAGFGIPLLVVAPVTRWVKILAFGIAFALLAGL